MVATGLLDRTGAPFIPTLVGERPQLQNPSRDRCWFPRSDQVGIYGVYPPYALPQENSFRNEAVIKSQKQSPMASTDCS
jgi:hypothetical protein